MRIPETKVLTDFEKDDLLATVPTTSLAAIPILAERLRRVNPPHPSLGRVGGLFDSVLR